MEEFTYNLITKKFKDSDYVYPVAIASDDKLNELCENIMASSRSISVSSNKITTNSEITDECYLVFEDNVPKKTRTGKIRKDSSKKEIAILLDRPFYLYRPYGSARKRATTITNKDTDDKFTTVIYEMTLNSLSHIEKYVEE